MIMSVSVLAEDTDSSLFSVGVSEASEVFFDVADSVSEITFSDGPSDLPLHPAKQHACIITAKQIKNIFLFIVFLLWLHKRGNAANCNAPDCS